MAEFYLRSALTIVYIAVFAAVTGLLLGSAVGWGAACGALVLLVAYHLRHLERLHRWATSGSGAAVPEGTGAWRNVLDVLYRRERAERRRRVHLSRLLVRARQAGRALPYGVVILDEEFRIVWCNDSSELHFGIRLTHDRSQIITHLVRQPDFVAYINGRQYANPLILKTARGEELILSVAFVPYAESQWLLLSRDITQAAKLETMRRDFVANVSHELRTPLTVLVGFLETIRELKLSTERSRDYLGLMMEQGRRMQRIIDDLLALSTLESAPEPPPDERIDMQALMQRLHEDGVALSAGRHRIRVDMQDSRDLLGAEHEIASAFSNLVSNAIRYTPAGGQIGIVWHALPDGAEFVVEDSGPGIAREHIPRLTERFYRVDRGRSRETGGTGLGLAIVKHALARHQAVLEIHSDLGKGSRFVAVFPAHRIVPRQEPQALPEERES